MAKELTNEELALWCEDMGKVFVEVAARSKNPDSTQMGEPVRNAFTIVAERLRKPPDSSRVLGSAEVTADGFTVMPGAVLFTRALRADSPPRSIAQIVVVSVGNGYVCAAGEYPADPDLPYLRPNDLPYLLSNCYATREAAVNAAGDLEVK